MQIEYEPWTPGADALQVIGQADAIARSYAAQGYDLTLRQLYYQFVSRDLIPNTQQSYKRLGSIINRARMSGFLDWDYIVDRTRNLESLAHWDSPAAIVEATARQFRYDRWERQPERCEVWVEKEALAGVIGQAADALDVAYFSCRGYVSQSELWGAGQRLGQFIADGQDVTVIHLGDHDPSGIDMTRDIEDRLRLFISEDLERGGRYDALERFAYGNALTIDRIALNMDQVRQYNPPPNPAKMTDSRVASYLTSYGRQSWELDALEPQVLDGLITSTILAHRDDDLWAEDDAREEAAKAALREKAAELRAAEATQ